MFQAIRYFGLALLMAACVQPVRAADVFTVDPVHSSVSFMISHAGISYIHGRFNDYSGKFIIDETDPAKSSFAMSIKIDSVDTGNQKRDEHLRAADYFDAAKYPTMSFKSTKVTRVKDGYEVAGEFTMRGVTRPVTLHLKGGEKQVEFPKGVKRIGFTTTPVIKRSEYGLSAGIPAVGDEVYIKIGVEAVKE